MSRERYPSFNGISLEQDDFVVVQGTDTDENFEDPISSDETSDVSNGESDKEKEKEPANESMKGAVEFLNVQRVYPTDRDIRIRCSVVSSFKHSEMDSIGIYRFGWSDPSEAIAIEYVQQVQRLEQFFTTLRSCFLPSNPTYDEYYQFCYVCQDGRTVMGSSQPFHLVRSIKSDGSNVIRRLSEKRPETLRTDSDSLGSLSSIVVVKPQKTQTPETCSKCTEMNSFKNQLDAALQSKALATTELVALQERYEHLTNIFEVQKEELRKLQQECDCKLQLIEALKSEKVQQGKTMNELMDELTNRTKELEREKEKLHEVNIERDRFVTNTAANQTDRERLVKENEGLQEQVLSLTERLNDTEIQVSDKDNWIASITTEMERLNESVRKLTDERDELNASIAEVSEQRDDLGSQIAVMQVDRESLANEKSQIMKDNDKLMEELIDIKENRDKIMAESAVIQDDRKQLIKENEGLQERVLVLTGELNDTVVQLSDKENWIASITDEMERLNESVRKLTEERDELKASIVEVSEQRDDFGSQVALMNVKRESLATEKSNVMQNNDQLNEELVGINVELIDIKGNLTESQARVEKLEYQLEAARASEYGSKQEKVKLVGELHDIQVMVQSMTGARRGTLKETLEAMQEEKVEDARIICQLREQLAMDEESLAKASEEGIQLIARVNTLTEEMKRLHDVNDCLRAVRSSGSDRDLEDADTLLRYLPSITQQLLNMSNASPDHHSTINELRDMIRFLLTAHERMKAEVKSLRKKRG